jgi:N-acetylglucosaminyldiphosphoundecaprenol N-acetyl-beta-D-mannosaminyltransferase
METIEKPDRISILGCPFDVVSLDETLERIRMAVRSGDRLQIVPGNVDFVMKARRDHSFQDVLRSSDIIVPDGVPIVWSARWLGYRLKGRVSGTDLAWDCAKLADEEGWRLALIGGVPGVAEEAAAQMRRAFRNADVVAIPTPQLESIEAELRVADQVHDSGASVVQVALGAPKQESWVRAHLVRSGATVGIGVGSAFDMISGRRPRPPKWMQMHGLEWAQRLRHEPRRLARRYLIEDLPFFPLVAADAMRRRMAGRTETRVR